MFSKWPSVGLVFFVGLVIVSALYFLPIMEFDSFNEDENLAGAASGSPGLFEVRVSSGDDDVEERTSSGSMYMTSSDLELVMDKSRDQEIGMRFNNIAIPRGATIVSASLVFTVDETSSGTTNLVFYGEDSDNAVAFSSSSYGLTSRQKTSASVSWSNVPAWSSVGATHETPDLSGVIQEIVSRSGWSSGNSLAIIVDGSGKRTAESYNGKSSKAPLLRIEWSGSGGTPPPPVDPFCGDGSCNGVESCSTCSADCGSCQPPPDGNPTLFESRVSSGNDDVEERTSSGSMYMTSSDLELVMDGSKDQEVGMRFNNIAIPQGATITSASIVFTVDETSSGTTNLVFYGENSDNALSFSSNVNDLTSRQKTSASVPWNNVPAWSSVGSAHETPDLSSVVQEIVNRNGWSSGNSLAIIVDGSGKRTAESYNGKSSKAPLLKIEWLP